jgi:two-component system, NtrC family, response regulator HydG
MRILLVDDEASLRLTLAANLELEGIDVVEAANAEQALERIATEPFDIVLSDVRMPGLSGVQMFERIKKIAPELPVILMTAYAVEEQLDQAIQGGVYTVLSKPFSVEQAVRALQRASTRPVVLVVDADGAGLLVRILRAAGLRTESATDHDDVGAAVRSGRVDVCIADLGTADCSALFADLTSAPTVSIIAVARPGDALVERLATSVHLFLQKPVIARDLVGGIAKARRDRAAG